MPADKARINTSSGIHTRALIASAGTGLGVVALASLITRTLVIGGFWSPADQRDYLACAALCGVVIAIGQNVPRWTLTVTAIVVGNPYWDFSVQEVRALPLIFATYVVVRAGTQVPFALVAGLIGVISSQYPSWILVPPRDWVVYYTDNGSAERILVITITIAAILLGHAAWTQARNADILLAKNDAIKQLRESDQLRIAQEERTKIAREIHDVVAHHVAAIVVRAQAAARVADRDPQEPRAAVEWIASSGQEALTAMRDVVRVLRSDSSSTPAQAPHDLREALESVFERIRAANIRVESYLQVPATLTSVEQFTVLRICQEALTNVLIHSGASAATVSLESDNSAVRLTVEDDGASASAIPQAGGRALLLGSGGSGLRGMRERADAVGGTVSAGPTEQGWRVRLTLPSRVRPRREQYIE